MFSLTNELANVAHTGHADVSLYTLTCIFLMVKINQGCLESLDDLEIYSKGCVLYVCTTEFIICLFIHHHPPIGFAHDAKTIIGQPCLPATSCRTFRKSITLSHHHYHLSE